MTDKILLFKEIFWKRSQEITPNNPSLSQNLGFKGRVILKGKFLKSEKNKGKYLSERSGI
jgi:hypothetical protein